MLVNINTANDVRVGADRIGAIEAGLRAKLGRYANRLTRLEVHLSDANADSDAGDDKHCTIEARPNGLDPVSVSDAAASMPQAISGATVKMLVALERTFGRLSSRKGH